MNADDNAHNDPQARASTPVDPLFDGRLEKPLLEMTVQERLDWIDQMMRFRHWARTELRMIDTPARGDGPTPGV